EPVDADLREMDTRRAVHTERQVELDGGGVEGIEIGVIQVARPERRRDHRADESERLRLAEDRHGVVHPLDGEHPDAVKAAAALPAPLRDPLVVEPAEADGDLPRLDARGTEAK